MPLRGRQLAILTSVRPPGFSADAASCELPLLTPCSKAVMSQALKATFSGFQKEQRRLGIPKSKCLRRAAGRGLCPWTGEPGCPGTRWVYLQAAPRGWQRRGEAEPVFIPTPSAGRCLRGPPGVLLTPLVLGARVDAVGKPGATSPVSPPPSISPHVSPPQTPGCGRSSRCASGCSGPPTSSAW